MGARTRIRGGQPIASALLLLLVACGGQTCAERNLVVKTAELRKCAKADTDRWKKSDSSLGVVGRDADLQDDFIDKYFANSPGHPRGWDPIAIDPTTRRAYYAGPGHKRTACGTITRVAYQAIAGDGEADCSQVLAPRLEYCDLLETGGDTCGEGHRSVCGGNANNACLMTEITPDGTFYGPLGNKFFCTQQNGSPSPGGRTEDSILQKTERDVCVYGPWVWDSTSSITEIHPAELFWWRGDLEGPVTGFRADDALWLLAFQDDSNRYATVGREYGFHDPDTHDLAHDPAVRLGTWIPWAYVPRHEEFLIQFVVPPARPSDASPIVYNVEEHEAVNVTTMRYPDTMLDADDGYQHAIEWDGRVVVAVNEAGTAEDNDVGVTFVNLCVDDQGNEAVPAGSLRGDIRLRARLGQTEPHLEGHLILRVWTGVDPCADARSLFNRLHSQAVAGGKIVNPGLVAQLADKLASPDCRPK